LNFSSVTTPGGTTASISNTSSVPLPAGFALGTPPVFYNISTTAVFSGLVQVCISYNPAQFAPPESAIRLLHDEGGIFVDRTISLDTVNHVVCGSVTHFSTFTIGTASIGFLYESLLREVRTAVGNAVLEDALEKKVVKSQAAFNRQRISDAIDELLDFQHKTQEEAGKAIDQAEATRLIGLAQAIITRLNAGE
jgi:hypothetical protein